MSKMTASKNRDRRIVPYVPKYRRLLGTHRISPTLFEKCAFLLRETAAYPPPDDGGILQEEVIDNGLHPETAENVRAMIAEGGGVVINAFDDIQFYRDKDMFLLADYYLRTQSYLRCVAAGVPCVATRWIYASYLADKILDLSSFTLPTGYSLLFKTPVPWHGKTDLFEGKTIMITSSDGSDLMKNWSPILEGAKADVVRVSFPIPEDIRRVPDLNLIIANPSLPYQLADMAIQRDIPVYSAIWLEQSILHHMILPKDVHQLFSHSPDY